MSSSRKIRFQPDQGDFALIDDNCDNSTFTPTFAGLIVNESMHGCALVLKKEDQIKLHTQYRVKVGQNAPYLAEAIWSKEIDEDVTKVGFHLLE